MITPWWRIQKFIKKKKKKKKQAIIIINDYTVDVTFSFFGKK